MGDRITPDSAIEGDRVRFWWDGTDRESIVTGARPPGKNFVDIALDDGTTLYGVFNYEVIEPVRSSSDAPDRTAPEPVVDSELRDQIAKALHQKSCLEYPNRGFGCASPEQHWQAWLDEADAALAVFAPALRKAWLDGHDSGFAAANVPDPWAKQSPAMDDLHVVTAVIQQELELAHSGEGYEPAAVAEEIVRTRVAPVLAAKDATVETVRIRLADALNLSHARTLDDLLEDVAVLHDEFLETAEERARFRAELDRVSGGWEARLQSRQKLQDERGKLQVELNLAVATRQQYAEERDEAVRLLKSCTGMGNELSHAERVEVLRSQLAQALRERDEARAAIRDIDAHATPIGLLHEDDPEGSPHHYIVTVGALHRALGKSNGTGVKCDVERDLLRWLHAEAAWKRDVAHADLRIRTGALADALGVARHPVDYYGWIELVSELRAEWDELRAHGVARDIGEANEQMRAQLEELETGLRPRLNGLLGALCGQGNELTGEMRAAIAVLDGIARQPDTEATEQAEPRKPWPSPLWHEQPCKTCGCDACDHDPTAEPVTPTEPRVWRKGDPEPPADVTAVLHDNSQRFKRYTQPDLWQAGPACAVLTWRQLTDRLGGYELTEVVDGAPSEDKP